ncbi:MAG: MMPL family transporter [Thermoleophilaceae bacterium]
MSRDFFGSLVSAVARRPVAVLVIVGVLALAGAALALRLEPQTGTDTLVSGSSRTAKADARFKRDFGDDAVVVLVKGEKGRGDLQRTMLGPDLGRLVKLEGCLSGNVPARGLKTLPPACRALSRLKPAKVVYGPGTFVNTAVNRINDELTSRQQSTSRQAEALAAGARRASARRGDPPARQRRLAEAARRQVQAKFTQDTLQLALRYGITGLPRLDNADFVSKLVFDTRKGEVGVPKSRFAYLFPSSNSALIQVRLRPGLSETDRNRSIELIRSATEDRSLTPTAGARYVVTGIPVVVQGLADAVRSAIFVLLGAALLLMAATLALVFRSRLRLLPLAVALAAAAMTFGGLALAGGSLTMASIAVLPVLIGLAVDYAIQFQARHDELRARRGLDAREASIAAAAAGGPTIASAGLATAVGFLVLLLSPVPLVRGFGALLVAGVVIALVCAVTAGFAALVRFGGPRRRPADLPRAFPRLRARASAIRVRAAGSGAGQGAYGGWRSVRLRAVEAFERAVAYGVYRPRRVLAVGLVVALVGLVADTQSPVVSDVRELVPRDLPALRDVNTLQDETGVAGEIDVTVRAQDITDPAVIGWMTKFQANTLAAAGYRSGDSCSQAKDPPDLCPALSLPDLFGSVDTGQTAQTRGLLDSVPAYFSQGVITPDRKTANLAFGVRLQSLEDQKRLIDSMEKRLDPPPGVRADVVGLPALAAQANSQLSSPLRRILTLLAALLAVFCVLLAFRRDRREAAVPLIPIALAVGWSSGLMFGLGLLPGPLSVKLNPMSVTLGALVIAISTEFSVLLCARYRQERDAGAPPARAVELAYSSTGAAVMASGLTAIAGFAALIASDIRMLRDFGILTVVDLGVSLLGVMVVLPAALIWAEQHGPFTLRDLDPRPLLGELADAARDGGARMPPLRRPRLRRPSVRALRLPRRHG